MACNLWNLKIIELKLSQSDTAVDFVLLFFFIFRFICLRCQVKMSNHKINANMINIPS